MKTIKNRLARLRRRMWPLPSEVEKPVAPRLMRLEKAEALALRNFEAGMAEIRKHPRGVRANALFSLSSTLLQRWRLDDALKANGRAISDYGRPKYYTQRAAIFHAMGRVPQMIDSARKAHMLDPLDHRAVRYLATFAPDLVATTRVMEQLVYTSRDSGGTATRASIAMFRAGRPEETLRALKRIMKRVELTPIQLDQVEYYAGVAAEFRSPRSALRYFNKSGPEPSTWGVSKAIGRGRCLLALGKPEEALAAIPEEVAYCAVRLEANLRLGRIGAAYSEYHTRKQVRGLKKTFPNYMSSGSKQLILTEGGPGDEIRFASLLNESGATVATCGPRLASLMRRSFPHIQFMEVERPRFEYRLPDYRERSMVAHIDAATFANNAVVARATKMDGVITSMGIVAKLRPDRHAFPQTPYLTADPARIDEWREFLPRDRPNVALNWRSMLYSIHRAQHYILAQQLEPLQEINAQFWLFQPGMRLSEFTLLRDMLGAALPPLLDAKDDFEGQAAFLSSMDAVVAPYNTTAELAGALGVPTLMMALTPATQWRCNPDGSDVWHGSGRVVCAPSKTMGRELAIALQPLLLPSRCSGQ